MPSLNDAYQQLQDANSNLQTLHNDEVALKASQDATTAAVNGVHQAVNQAVVYLRALVEGQVYTNQALFHLSQQTDTMICTLEHISKNTCLLLNEAHQQTALQTAMSRDTAEALDIAKTAHPQAALDLARREALRQQTEACCPPKVEPPVCNYQPCPAVRPLPAPPRADIPDKSPVAS
jgi:hypothetical protein